MNILNLLVGLNSVILIFLVVNVFKPFIGSYAAKKGENLATKEDIAQLTKIAEEIRAEITDKVWDRQRQWELKRDAVLAAIRAYAALSSALVILNSLLSASLKSHSDNTDAEWSATIQVFRNSRTSFWQAYQIAALTVGGQFSNAMSSYFLLTGSISRDMRQNKKFLDSAKCKELSLNGNNVILSARQALGIKDAGELSPIEVQN